MAGMPLIPLFPLEVVLFPEAPLPLHIFEPRYKEMIGECLERKQRFGVVRAEGGDFAPIGCTAEILLVTKRYDDGRLDILTIGRQRFEITTVNSQRDFLQGEVEFFDDESQDRGSAEQRRSAIKLQQELMSLAGEKLDEIDSEHEQLSFVLAGSLPLDADFKQALLAIRSEGERLKTLIAYYEALLPKLRHTLRARSRAGGNGHVS